MDDRVMLIQPAFAPDHRFFQLWPALRILHQRLSDLWPVDLFRWPCLKGEKVVGGPAECQVTALNAQVTDQHHVVDLGTGGTPLLIAMTQNPGRSLVSAGNWPSPGTIAARGDAEQAKALGATFTIGSNPAQIIPAIMQGADPPTIERSIALALESCDRTVLEHMWGKEYQDTDFTGLASVTIPSLYIAIPVMIAGSEKLFDVYQSFAPNAVRDEVSEWGIHVHEEAGGHELAGKVIPFIEEVIAHRANTQT
jgi:hypothetical protein